MLLAVQRHSMTLLAHYSSTFCPVKAGIQGFAPQPGPVRPHLSWWFGANSLSVTAQSITSISQGSLSEEITGWDFRALGALTSGKQPLNVHRYNKAGISEIQH